MWSSKCRKRKEKSVLWFHPRLIKHIIVCYIIVCNEWTELNCSSEAAPEELEEHSMVAHEVQTHYLMLLRSFC